MKYGFWIDGGTGEVVFCQRKHIDVVLNQPERFGFTRERLVAIYEKYGEKLGFEGFAREEILREAIRRGWIRVRRYAGRREVVSINVPALSPEIKEVLSRFAASLIKGFEVKGPSGLSEHIKDYPDTRVNITDPEGNLLLTTTLQAMADGNFENPRGE